MCRVEPAGSEQSGTPQDKPSRHSSKMSLINALKSVGEAGQPWRSPRVRGMGSERTQGGLPVRTRKELSR